MVPNWVYISLWRIISALGKPSYFLGKQCHLIHPRGGSVCRRGPALSAASLRSKLGDTDSRPRHQRRLLRSLWCQQRPSSLPKSALLLLYPVHLTSSPDLLKTPQGISVFKHKKRKLLKSFLTSISSISPEKAENNYPPYNDFSSVVQPCLGSSTVHVKAEF